MVEYITATTLKFLVVTITYFNEFLDDGIYEEIY